MERLSTARDWAWQHFGSATLGDRRRTRRLVDMAAAIAGTPGKSLPGTLPGWAALKGAYRLLESDAVSHGQIIGPHLELTRQACAGPGEYLVIEDTTALSFTSRQAEGLGWVGDDETAKGLLVHSSLALRIEGWSQDQEPAVTVVGLLGQRVWSRNGPPKKDETKEQRLQRSRESERWGAVFGQIDPQGAHLTYVADRESDIFTVIADCRARQIGYVVRAAWPRKVAGEARTVFEAVAAAPVLGTFLLPLRARPGAPARDARLEVRAVAVAVRPPAHGGKGLAPEPENVIEVREPSPPAGVEPIHWVLLTDWPVSTFTGALRAVRIYATRWLIEEYHKALKTGTGIEHSQLATRRRLEALLGVLAVVAVRLVSMKLLCTTKPEDAIEPGEVGPEALGLLEAEFGRPKGGWTNRTVLVAIARLGGFLARKGDGDPGWITIWRGWRRLMTMTQGLDLFLNGTRCGQ